MKTPIAYSVAVLVLVSFGLMVACESTPKAKCENLLDKVITCLDHGQIAPMVLVKARAEGVRVCLLEYVKAPDLSEKQFKALSGMTCEDILAVSGLSGLSARPSSADMAGGTNVGY
jgi:hypothetical protein